MAYVLGFFLADGSLVINKRGSHYLDFHITDGDILEKIKYHLGSNHKIQKRIRNEKHKMIFRLQIGSKKMFKSLNDLGIEKQKTGKEKMPPVPKKYFSDFLRGYFDGDGNIWSGYTNKNRKNPTPALTLTFTCKSKEFLSELKDLMNKLKCTGNIVYSSKAYRLNFSTIPSLKIYESMYNNITNDLYLLRKKVVFDKFINKFNRGIRIR